ncbi:MAG: 50S ribosomal protein L32 [Candidatus Paceibacterota bacterium]
MGGVPMRHHTSSKVGRRRSHEALTPKQHIAPCPECKHPVMSHRACSACGFYRGRKIAVKKK